MEAKFDNLIKLLNKIGEEARDSYKEKLKKGDAIASGKLYNSVNYRVVSTGTGVRLEFTLLDYWIHVEEGRKAGGKMPPISSIRSWMVTRGIPETPGGAYRIARAISKRGIKPRPYMKEVKKEIRSWSSEIQKAIKSDYDIYLKQKKTS